MQKFFPFCVLLTFLSLVVCTLPKSARANTDIETINVVSEEELSRQQRDELLRFMRSVWTIGEAGRRFDEDVDYADSINLWFSDENSTNVPWWQVFWALLSVSEITNHVKNEEYDKAIQRVSELYLEEFIKSNARLEQLAGFQIYSSLATLAVSIPLNNFVDLVDRRGFENHMEAYKSARHDIGLTHEQISDPPSSSILGLEGPGGTVYFTPNGWIDSIDYDSDVGGEWAGRIRTMSPIGGAPLSVQQSDVAYDLIRHFLDAKNVSTTQTYEDRRTYVLAMQTEIDQLRAADPSYDEPTISEAPSAGEGAAGDGSGGGGGGSIENSGDNLANSLFVSAVRKALDAAKLDESERRTVYESIATTFDRIVAEFPDTRQAQAILAEAVPNVDFALLVGPSDEVLDTGFELDLETGLYSIDPALCAVEATVGDAWGTLFQSVSSSSVKRGSERNCDLLSVEAEGDSLFAAAKCSVEGETEIESWKWERISASSFYETEGRNAGKSYTLCNSAEPTDRTAERGQTDVTSPPPQTHASKQHGQWGPGIVSQVYRDLIFAPCRERDDKPSCLSDEGVSAEAIEFAVAIDQSGEVFATDFLELGAVDLAVTEYNGASPILLPALLNGDFSISRIAMLQKDELSLFADSTSKSILQEYPDLWSSRPSVSAHRVLAGGGQRFVVTHPLSVCRACENIAVAVEMVDFDTNGTFLDKKRIGIVGLGLKHVAGYSLERPSRDKILGDPSTLQYVLNALGYEAGPMDGYPGPATRQALMEFQIEHCLAPTGQPDMVSVERLFSANAFSAPCADTQLPDGIEANNPLLAGVYVDNPAYCQSANIPYESLHLSQRIVRPGGITFGAEGGCEARRSDIRKNGTLFRGTCSEGNQTYEASWTFDLEGPESFLDVTMGGQGVTPRRFEKCADDSLLRERYDAWFENAPRENERAQQSAAITPEENVELFEPQRGTALRSELLETVRPIAEELYGSPVEFIVETMRIAGNVAFVEVFAQRPGGEAIDMRATPGFRGGKLFLEPGDPNAIDALLRRENGSWRVIRHAAGATEAWWLDDCPTWAALFPRLCDGVQSKEARTQSEIVAARPDVSAGRITTGLRDGLYTTEPSLCAAGTAPLLSRRITGDRIDFGGGIVCRPTTLAPTTNGAQYYVGACSGLLKGDKEVWTWRRSGDGKFLEESGIFRDGKDPDRLSGRVFTLCSGASGHDSGAANYQAKDENEKLERGDAVLSGLAGVTVQPSGAVMVDFGETAAEVVAALLLAFGVEDDNLLPKLYGGSDLETRQKREEFLREARRLAPRFKGKNVNAKSPMLPMTSGPYSAEKGSFNSCLTSQAGILDTGVSGVTSASPIVISYVPTVRIGNVNGFGHSAFCADQKTQSISSFEARYGLESTLSRRFWLNSSVNLPVPRERATEVARASEEGRLRLQYGCRFFTPRQSDGSPHRNAAQIGHCAFGTLSLMLIDPTAEEWESIEYSVDSRGLSGPRFTSVKVQRIVASAAEKQALSIDPMSRSFDISRIDGDSVAEIVTGFVGEPEDIDLNYCGGGRFPGSRVHTYDVYRALGEGMSYTRNSSGNDPGGIFVIDSAPESALVHHDYFGDCRATAILGEIEDIRVLDVRELTGSDCEWNVTYRSWLKDPTAFGDAVASLSGKDGYTSSLCFRVSRSGFEIIRKDFVDF